LHGFADAMKLAVRTFEPGEYLVRQGEIGREVFLLRSGECDVVVADGKGNERVVATRGKGEFIGEMAVKLDEKAGGKPRTASVVAKTPVAATVLSRADMQWAVDHDYSLENQIEEVIQKRRQELSQKSL
jgi:protein serine kinase H